MQTYAALAWPLSPELHLWNPSGDSHRCAPSVRTTTGSITLVE